MVNKIFILFSLLLITSSSVYSQDFTNGISTGIAPYVKVQYPPNLLKDSPNSYYNRAFASCVAAGPTLGLGPFEFWLNGTGFKSIYSGTVTTNFIQAGCFAGDGFWYGVKYGTNILVRIDTSAGSLLELGFITGVTTVTGLAYDFTTDTMYAANFVTGNNQIGRINLLTRVVTMLPGIVSTTGVLIDVACSNSGQLYGHVINGSSSASQIYSVNKTTGVGTALPQNTGFNANYAQGMSWDHSVDTGYLAAYNTATSTGELRKIDIATGATTFIAGFNCQVDGLAIPGCSGPKITHTPLLNSTNVNGPYIVNAIIMNCSSGINPSGTKIFWSRNNPNITDSVQMTNSSGNNWTGNIPGNGTDAIYRYYIRTVDSLGRFATAPLGAPSNLYSFIVTAIDTIKPVITHTPVGPTPKSFWPIPITANVTDNIGVDSVWVEWYKNTPITIKEFKLAANGGNNYSAAFNSINSDVNTGDIIYYTVKAVDISPNHNVARLPASGYFSFGIINLSLCEGFSNLTFPPNNWTVTGAGIIYWSRNSVSSYGIGTGSTKFDFYDANTGTTAQFVTCPFDPSSQLDSLRFDVAHAFFSAGYIDTLKIDGSTDNGMTWINIWTLWSQSNFTDPHSLSTVSQTNPFLPTASQWKTLTYPLVNGTNKVRFNAISGFGNNVFIDSICQKSFAVGIGKNENNIPLTYSLSQNYPNPFNPVTKINFAIPKQSLTVLKIYDVLGREVMRLVNEVKQPGSYNVDFDGTNLSSGVYFYKLESGTFSDVKRMMLIK